MNSVISDAKAQATGPSAQAAADFFNLILTVPEFRAGFVLTGLAMIMAILLVLSTAGGAFAGFVRSKQSKNTL
jgi:hypothetical protein